MNALIIAALLAKGTIDELEGRGYDRATPGALKHNQL
jgi:hypothetical protein